MQIPFNVPYIAPNTESYLHDVLGKGVLAGGGYFSQKCQDWIEQKLNTKVVLTNSCTSALELSIRLLNLTNEDEVIVPSFTYVSTANSVVMGGACPVFADIKEDSLNLSIDSVREKITPNTKAIICVHYGGRAADLNELKQISQDNNFVLIEDSAHSTGGVFKDRALGTHGGMGVLSFHETKNIVCGTGGAFLSNNQE